MSKWNELKETVKAKQTRSNQVFKVLLALGLIAVGLPSMVAAAVNISSLIDFASAILDNQDTWIGLIVFGVVIIVVRKFSGFMGGILTIKK